eukprot:gene13221-14570_t
MPLAPGPYSLQTSGAPSTVQWPWATNEASSVIVHCGRMTPQPPLKPTWYTQPGVYISSTAHQGQQPVAPASIVHEHRDMPRLSTNMATRPSNMPTLSRLGATMEQSSHLTSIDWQEEDIEHLQQKQEALKRANAHLEEATKELERQHKNAGLSVAERVQRLEVFDEDSSIATTAMRRINNMLNRGEKHAKKGLPLSNCQEKVKLRSILASNLQMFSKPFSALTANSFVYAVLERRKYLIQKEGRKCESEQLESAVAEAELSRQRPGPSRKRSL